MFQRRVIYVCFVNFQPRGNHVSGTRGQEHQPPPDRHHTEVTRVKHVDLERVKHVYYLI